MSSFEAEQRELAYWRESEHERPGAESLEVLVSKFGEAQVALEKLYSLGALLPERGTLLELGAGQGWLSCLLKRRLPDATVLCSELSHAALQTLPMWERAYGARVDAAFAARVYELPVPDASIDAAFCFGAAHHFREHRRTLLELSRVLRPGGVAIYMHEPSCRAFVHPLAHWRVNRKRPHVPEDVLIYPRIQELAEAAGLNCELRFAPTTTQRGPTETLYYSVLQRSAALQKLLPCTIDYVFRKA